MTIKYRVPYGEGLVATRTSQRHLIGGHQYRFVAIRGTRVISWNSTRLLAERTLAAHARDYPYDATAQVIEIQPENMTGDAVECRA